MAETMKGYVFKDVNDLRLEDRPIPTIQDPRDAIVRVAPVSYTHLTLPTTERV